MPEIITHCEDVTRFEAGTSGTLRADILNALASEIVAMPLYKQAIIVASAHTNYVHSGDCGFFDPDSFDIHWGIRSFGPYGLNTMHHEEGHRIDHIIRMRDKDSYSNTCAIWQAGIDQKFLKQPVSSHVLYRACSSLYEDSKELFNQMAADYDYEDYDIETFAEMNCHHSCVFRDLKGDESKVDKALMHAYPILWPLFRDVAIPKMHKTAMIINPRYRDLQSRTKVLTP
jgi:hypothetical protein